MMKKERKMKNIGFTRKILDDFQGLPLLNFFRQILDDFHDFVSECVSFQRKINNPFWGLTVFPRNSDTFYQRKSTKKIAKASPFIYNYSVRII